MELREWAIGILSGDTLEAKLAAPDLLTDLAPGPELFWDEPTRPAGMQFRRHSREDKLPPFHALGSLDHRAACLHRFAGHELLAVEIMAYALLAFPNAPASFRKGLANTLKEEQEHVRLYMERLSEMGVRFGDMPFFRHFWKHTPYLRSPLQYVSMMSLTFEMANLDFAPHYGQVFKQHGDDASSLLMGRIFQDEIAHVRFGWRWLCNLKQENQTAWDTWLQSLPPLINPDRAKGFIFREEPRQTAGIPDDWIDNLKNIW